jgi:TonB family protein
MGYQALLFCPDEKLARVVSQVFSELDFTVDPVHEPFAAVKQLMAQRYDAIIVDCENEQNASLLFKSARNSNFNQSSLAFALVEGQTGVAKAYRIGANLVLTKPISVEHAKGTLRVARGLLRKNSDAAAAGANAMAAKAGAGSSGSVSHATAQGGAAAPASIHDQFESSMSQSTGLADHSSLTKMFQASEDSKQSSVVSTQAESKIATESESRATGQQVSGHAGYDSFNEDVTGNAVAADVLHAPAASTSPSAHGSAAAAAPAREAAASPSTGNVKEKEKRKKKSESKATSGSRGDSLSIDPSATMAASPSFGESLDKDSGEPGRKRKILIAAVIVLALAALGYFSNNMIERSTTHAPRTVSAPSDPQQTGPKIRPMAAPEPAPAANPTDVASSGTTPATSKPAPSDLADKPPAAASKFPLIRMAENFAAKLEPETQKIGSALGLVKSQPAVARAEVPVEQAAPVDDPTPPPSSTLAMASANDTKLSSLMSPASFNIDKPSLATLRVSQGVSQGLLIKRVQPTYPQAALAVHTQGAVQIEATITKEGNVVNPKVLHGDAVLARSAVEAVRQWRYKPYYLDGQPVQIQTQITINFKAD